MNARMPLMAGNWKMHFTIAESCGSGGRAQDRDLAF